MHFAVNVNVVTSVTEIASSLSMCIEIRENSRIRIARFNIT